jgi:adenylate cyclase
LTSGKLILLHRQTRIQIPYLRVRSEYIGRIWNWAAYQRGLWHVSKCTPDDNLLAQKFFQQAMDLDSSFSGAYGGLAIAHGQAIGFQTRGLPETLSSIEVLARRAVALDGTDAL